MHAQSHTDSTITRPPTARQTPGLQVKTHVKAGGIDLNHNETLVQAARPTTGLQVKTHVKAGGIDLNHNETLVQAARPATGLQVKTHVRRGSTHNLIPQA